MTSTRLTREQQRARTREDLLQAAAEVFARHGYHATSVDMVAEAAGYTKGAVYSNFSSKEELFLALLEERREQTMADVQRVMDESAPADRAEAFGERRDRLAQWTPEWFLLEAEFELYAARHPEVRERVAERQAATREVVTAAVERHIADLDLEPAYPVEEIAQLVVAVGDGLSLMALNNPEMETGRLMQVFLEVMTKGGSK